MKISTRGRYGLQLLIDLAEHSGEKHVSLVQTAQRQGISLRYLEQLAVILKRAGLLRSFKGQDGGYALARPPEEIRVDEALRALEGDMLVSDPPPAEGEETGLQRCIRLAVLEKLNEAIARVIETKTIASLAGGGMSMFYT